MNNAQREQLIQAGLRAWLTCGSPLRAIADLADELNIALDDERLSILAVEVADIAQERI